jgi:SAM-dependent methyltransferase
MRAHALAAFYRGSAVECPCCGRRFRKFRAANNRPAARCPFCDSAERHRALWLYLRDEMRLPDATERQRVLHFAPEPQIADRLADLDTLDYTTADLADVAMEQMDMTDIPRPDGSFDIVIVNHVLEHIPDDAAALREVARVLRPGGLFLTMHPVQDSLAQTYEDPTITSPAERLRHFGQDDHVRVYGPDFVDRVAAAGLDVTTVRYGEEIASPEARRRYGLVEQRPDIRPSAIFLCRKPVAG